MKHATIAVLGLTVAVTTPVGAEDRADLEPITVTAPRVDVDILDAPAALSVLDQEDVQQGAQGLGLDESLRSVPGLFAQNRYNFAQGTRISLRGFGARAPFGVRGVRVVVDGIPATVTDGQAVVDGIDTRSIDSIEVIRGPFSALYGNASGGVISITTEDGPPEGVVGGTVMRGSHGFEREELKAGGETGRWNYIANASRFELDGYRDQSRVRRQTFNGKLRYTFEAGETLTAIVNAVDTPRADDPGALTRDQVREDRTQATEDAEIFKAGDKSEQYTLGLVYHNALSRSEEFTVHTYYTRRNFRQRLPSRFAGIPTFNRDFGGAGAQYVLDDTLFGRSNRLTVGVETERQRDDRVHFDYASMFPPDRARGEKDIDQVEDVLNVAAYIQNEHDITPRLRATLGARYDSTRFKVDDDLADDQTDFSGRRTFQEASYLGGVSYALAPTHRVYANVATAFETPTARELAPADPDQRGFNPDLDPQTSVNYEVGVKGSYGPTWRYDVALFRIRVKDEIVPFSDEDLERDFARNAARTRRDGVEVGLSYFPTDNVRFRTSYTYSEFRFREFEDPDTGEDLSGKRLPGIPRNQLFAEMAYRDGRGRFAALNVFAVDSMYGDDPNTVNAPGYAVVNARLGTTVRLDGWQVKPFVGLNNLLDKKYSANIRINQPNPQAIFEPAPRFHAHAGVSITY